MAGFPSVERTLFRPSATASRPMTQRPVFGMALSQTQWQKISATLDRLGIPQPNTADERRHYERAFTHKSFTLNRGLPHSENYEQLEYEGDKFLGLLLSDYIFEIAPEMTEADSTGVFSAILENAVFSKLARTLQLEEAIVIDTPMTPQGMKGVLADVFEALFGALFKNRQIDRAQNLVKMLFSDIIPQCLQSDYKQNYKEELLNFSRAGGHPKPVYTTQTVQEFAADDPCFTVSVSVGKVVEGIGTGTSKKRAERDAAKNALAILEARSKEQSKDAAAA